MFSHFFALFSIRVFFFFRLCFRIFFSFFFFLRWPDDWDLRKCTRLVEKRNKNKKSKKTRKQAKKSGKKRTKSKTNKNQAKKNEKKVKTNSLFFFAFGVAFFFLLFSNLGLVCFLLLLFFCFFLIEVWIVFFLAFFELRFGLGFAFFLDLVLLFLVQFIFLSFYGSCL